MKTFREKLHTPLVGLMLFGVAVGPVAGGTLDIPFNDTNFIAHQPINNDYWPLLNGSVFVYYADSEDGCAVNRLTVTGAKKSDFSAPYDNIVAWEVEDLEWLDR